MNDFLENLLGEFLKDKIVSGEMSWEECEEIVAAIQGVGDSDLQLIVSKYKGLKGFENYYREKMNE